MTPEQEQMLINLRDQIVYHERRKQEAQNELNIILGSLQSAGFRLNATLVPLVEIPKQDEPQKAERHD